MGLGVVVFRRTPRQQQSAGQLALLKAKHRSQQQAEGVIRVDGERLLQGFLGLLRLALGVEQASLLAVHLGIAGMGRHQLVHEPQGRFVLTLRFLLEGAAHLSIDGLTAPAEFFAAAAGTKGIGVARHGMPSCGNLARRASGNAGITIAD